MAWQPDMEIVMQRTLLPPKTHLPWILHHQNTQMPEQDNELSDEYCEETDAHCPLAELLELFCQLKDQFAILKSQSTTAADLLQLTDKLQHLSMMLHPPPQPSGE